MTSQARTTSHPANLVAALLWNGDLQFKVKNTPQPGSALLLHTSSKPPAAAASI
jgi:hypothetical protein